MTKKPWLAALLNVLVSGSGYLYLGKRKLFGVLVLGTWASSLIWLFTTPGAKEIFNDFWNTLAGVLFSVALGIDAYHEAKRQS